MASACAWPAGLRLLPNKQQRCGMLPHGHAPGSPPGMLPGRGRAVPLACAPLSLRASSQRAPLPASAAARDPDKAQVFDPTVTSRFFNREPEFEFLNTIWDDDPERIRILTGPQNCGKTVRTWPAAAAQPSLRLRAPFRARA